VSIRSRKRVASAIPPIVKSKKQKKLRGRVTRKAGDILAAKTHRSGTAHPTQTNKHKKKKKTRKVLVSEKVSTRKERSGAKRVGLEEERGRIGGSCGGGEIRERSPKPKEKSRTGRELAQEKRWPDSAGGTRGRMRGTSAKKQDNGSARRKAGVH